MTSTVELMMNTEIEMMTFSKSDDDIKTLTALLFDHEKLSFQSKVKKCIEMIRMSTRFDHKWTHANSSTEANVSVLTAAWKVAKHCADEDGKLKQLDDHYFHKELNESIFLLENGLINEGAYLYTCKQLKKQREHDENIINMCACSAIGNITTASIRKVRSIEGSVEPVVTVIDDVLQIVCLPCGWNAGTTRVIHGS